MFESLKAAIQDLLQGRIAPTHRRAAVSEMKSALVRAKLGVEDLRAGVEHTRNRLATERDQLATARRRGALAAGINDTETVALAAKYEQQYGEHLSVLERKLEVQLAEVDLAEREFGEMVKELKAADAGAGSTTGVQGEGTSPTGDEALGLPDDANLHSELDGLARQRARGDADAAANEKLAELKKRMGRY